MNCKYCGAPLEDGQETCPACGRALIGNAEDERNSAAAEQEPLSEAAPAPEAESAPEAASEPEAGPETQAETEPETQSEAETETASAPTQDENGETEADAAETPRSGVFYENILLNQQEAEAEEAAEEAPAKKKSSGALIAVAAAVVCLIIVVAVAAVQLVQGSGGDDSLDEVVMTCEEQDFSLTNAELSYYYWSEYYYLLNYYGDYLSSYTGLDTSTPLDEQQYSDDMTWEEYFIQTALSSAQETMSFVFAANEAGFTLSGDYETALQSTLDSFDDYAISYGFTDEDGNADVEGYLQDSYGAGATYETFVNYLTNSYLCAAYSSEIYDSISFTEQEVSDYYDEHASEYEEAGVDKTTRLVDVRHILIECDMDDEDASAEALAQAEEILAEWQADDGTEEGFAELANEYSADTGSNTNGGLYEDVYPGEMVTNFNDWCFDESRQVGDTGIVESTYGYHIMYFSGFGEEYWYQSAQSDMLYERYNTSYEEITSAYTFAVNEDAIVIADPTSQTETMEE